MIQVSITHPNHQNSLGEYLEEAVRKTRTLFGRCEAFYWSAIYNLVKKIELVEQVSDVKNKAT